MSPIASPICALPVVDADQPDLHAEIPSVLCREEGDFTPHVIHADQRVRRRHGQFLQAGKPLKGRSKYGEEMRQIP
jgi:hypothetical protein